MGDRRDLAVHHVLRAADAPAEGLPDRLVAKAYAEDRYLPGEALNQRHANAGLVRRAGTRRDDDRLRFPRRDFCERNRIVAMDVHIRTELAQILDEVVGEAVVVVDHQKHGGPVVWLAGSRSANFASRDRR